MANRNSECVHREIDPKTNIEYRMYISPNDIPVRGNAMSSGDNQADKRYEDEILARLDRGDTWAWASVEMQARQGSAIGRDYLGGCCYENTKEFIANGYFEDMKRAAREDLKKQAGAYFEPNNAGLDSEPRNAGKRVARLLWALGNEVNDYICKGEITEDVRTLRMKIMDNLQAAGWRVSVLESGKYSVLPPKEEK